MITSNITGAAAYAAVQGASGETDDATSGGDSSFGGVLQNAFTSLDQLGQDADRKAVQGMSGKGSLTDVVMAVSNAETALTASVAVRDKVISAYQEIMRMSV